MADRLSQTEHYAKAEELLGFAEAKDSALRLELALGNVTPERAVLDQNAISRALAAAQVHATLSTATVWPGRRS